MHKIDYSRIINAIIGLTSTLGASGTIILLRVAGRLTRKVFKILLWIAIVGVAWLIYTGNFNLDVISQLVNLNHR